MSDKNLLKKWNDVLKKGYVNGVPVVPAITYNNITKDQEPKIWTPSLTNALRRQGDDKY